MNPVQSMLSSDPAALPAPAQAPTEERPAAAEAIRIRVGSPPWSKPCGLHPGESRAFIPGESAIMGRACYAECAACGHERTVTAPLFRRWCRQGLPPLYFGVKLADLEFGEPERTVLEEFAREPLGVLSLLGSAGTGKTSAACALLQTGRTGAYAVRADLLGRLRATYAAGRGEPSGEELKRRMRETPLLVLDEFEKCDQGADGQRLLFELLDGRYRECRPTVLCGNCSPEEFKAILGGPAWSRITGTGGTVLEFTGRDRRPDGKAAYARQATLVRRLQKLAEELE